MMSAAAGRTNTPDQTTVTAMASALIVGFWRGHLDPLFSCIKRFGAYADDLLPDRSRVTMGEAFLKAFTLLPVKACLRRGTPGLVGAAVPVPVSVAAASVRIRSRIRDFE